MRAKTDCFRSARGIELREDRGDVKLDRVFADAKPVGDEFVRQSFCHELQYLVLTGCQRLTFGFRS